MPIYNEYCNIPPDAPWFPTPPGTGPDDLPQAPPVVENPETIPPNSAPVPPDFNEDDPDLCQLFNDINNSPLPPEYEQELNPPTPVPPYTESIPLTAIIRVLTVGQYFGYPALVVKEVDPIETVVAIAIGPYELTPTEAEIEILAGGIPIIDDPLVLEIPEPAVIEFLPGSPVEITTTFAVDIPNPVYFEILPGTGTIIGGTPTVDIPTPASIEILPGAGVIIGGTPTADIPSPAVIEILPGGNPTVP